MSRKPSKVKFSISLPGDLNEALEEICRKRRGVTKTAIVEAAIKEFLFPEGSDKTEEIIGRHLNRIERRVKSVERSNEILGEAFSLFVRAWLTSTMEVPEEQREIAERSGGRRYKKFLEVLGQRLQSGKSLFDDLPQDVFFRPEEFFAAPQVKEAAEAEV